MLRRRGQSDERRRRVLTEDATSQNDTASTVARRSSKNGGSDYSKTLLDEQPRLTDLIPHKTWVHAALFVSAMASAGGLVAMHHWWAGPDEASRIFDVSAPGSLACWFSSALLLVATAVALICYSLRRHKQSDYYGRYRVWLWAGSITFLMSVAATAPWHKVVADELAAASGVNLPGGPVLWWLGPCGLAVAAVTLRLFFEMVDCRAAAAALVLAILGMGVSTVFANGWGPALDESQIAMVSGGSWLAASVLLLFSFLLHARRIILEVQGLVVAKPKQAKGRSGTENEDGQKASNSKSSSSQKQKTRRIDAAHKGSAASKRRSDLEPDMAATTKTSSKLSEAVELEVQRFEEDDEPPARKQKRRRVRPRASIREEYDDYEESPGAQAKLSKSERKRQRKLKTQQRRAA